MTTKNNRYSDSNQEYDDNGYAIYCNFLEKEYKEAKETGLFEILKLLKLDKKYSDSNLVQAIDYFNQKEGRVEENAPVDFLTDREKIMVNQDGKFRPELYCMLLSQKFSEAIQNKSGFIKHSLKYAFDSE